MHGAHAEERRTRALWNWISLCMPFIGFVAGVAGFGIHGELGLGHPMESVRCGFRVWFGFSILGIATAGIAVVRMERWRGITAAAIVLNLCVLALTWQVGWRQW